MTEAISGKAVTYTGAGGYEVIKVVDRPVRPPEADEVRIQVKAAGVNPTDTLLRSAGGGDGTSLVIPGMDASGTIESIGAGVDRFTVGQEVMAALTPRRPDGGAQAEYIVVPAASVVPVPGGTSLHEAATLPMNGLTALGALQHAGLKPGQTFAVSGGAGLLAHYAIAAAKRQELKVIADAKPEEIDLVKGYGADVVVERGEGFVDAIRREVPEGVDALLDTALLGEKAFGAIRDGGTYIPVRGWKDKPSERGIEIKPIFVNTVLDRTDWLDELSDMVVAGEITLKVTGEYPPERTADAQRAIEAGGLRGRPVIVF
jgi:NADPH:quinone reductase-like Zn-dependent oxidoreductase